MTQGESGNIGSRVPPSPLPASNKNDTLLHMEYINKTHSTVVAIQKFWLVLWLTQKEAGTI